MLRHGAVNQLTAYDLHTAQPLWDVGLGGAPVGLSVLAGDTAATARAHVADECGWWMTFDGNGEQVAGKRATACGRRPGY